MPREFSLDVYLQYLESPSLRHFSTLNSQCDLHGSGSRHDTNWGGFLAHSPLEGVLVVVPYEEDVVVLLSWMYTTAAAAPLG